MTYTLRVLPSPTTLEGPGYKDCLNVMAHSVGKAGELCIVYDFDGQSAVEFIAPGRWQSASQLVTLDTTKPDLDMDPIIIDGDADTVLEQLSKDV